MMPPGRPLILLSNDDGHSSAGLRALHDALRADADVVTVAPETEQSATSHALSLHRPLRLRKVDEAVFAVDGTPADCVYVALHSGPRILTRWPDLVISGINYGMNLGQDVFYSGTVAAAREAALRGLPAIAASAHPDQNLGQVAALTARLALTLLDKAAAPRPMLLNLNIPRRWSGEVRATKLGERVYEHTIEFRTDPRGREYLWIGGVGVTHRSDPGSDTDAFEDRAASLTPLVLDLTRTSDAPIVEALANSLTHPLST